MLDQITREDNVVAKRKTDIKPGNMAVPVEMSKQESEWRARDDMRILISAQEIMGDAKRFNNAVKLAKKERDNIQGIIDDSKEEMEE